MSGYKKRDHGGRHPYEPTDLQRGMVMAMAACRATHPEIADFLGISERMVRVTFPHELRTGKAQIKGRVIAQITKKAMAGDTACLLFLAKTQFGFSEKMQHEHTGQNGGPIDVRTLSTDQLLTALAAVGEGPGPPTPENRAGETEYAGQPSGLV